MGAGGDDSSGSGACSANAASRTRARPARVGGAGYGLENVAKRYVIHAAAHNLGVLLRKLFGVGTPRSLQDRAATACAALLAIANDLWRGLVIHTAQLHRRNRRPKLYMPDPRQLAAA